MKEFTPCQTRRKGVLLGSGCVRVVCGKGREGRGSRVLRCVVLLCEVWHGYSGCLYVVAVVVACLTQGCVSELREVRVVFCDVVFGPLKFGMRARVGLFMMKLAH